MNGRASGPWAKLSGPEPGGRREPEDRVLERPRLPPPRERWRESGTARSAPRWRGPWTGRSPTAGTSSRSRPSAVSKAACPGWRSTGTESGSGTTRGSSSSPERRSESSSPPFATRALLRCVPATGASTTRRGRTPRRSGSPAARACASTGPRERRCSSRAAGNSPSCVGWPKRSWTRAGRRRRRGREPQTSTTASRRWRAAFWRRKCSRCS